MWNIEDVVRLMDDGELRVALIAALISITIVAAVTAIGTSLVNNFNPVSTALN